MLLTKVYQLKLNTAYQSFLGQLCTDSRKLYNHANYLVRNIRSAMYKASIGKTLSVKEEEVLSKLRSDYPRLKQAEKQRFDKAVKSCKKTSGLKAHVRMRKLLKHKPLEPLCFGNVYTYCTYEFLDAYLKDTKDPNYYALPSQVNQQVLRKLVKDWKSYFESLKSYKKSPASFTGRPKAPKYKKDQAVATFTNQVSEISISKGKLWVSFTGCDKELCLGNQHDFEGLKYVRSEVVPFYGTYRICVTFEDKVDEVKPPKNPKRVLGIDHGIDNFMACFSNCEMPALLYKGMWIKSQNQWFNKRKAFLVSELTKGEPTKTRPTSNALDALSINRDNCFRDYFYKCAHDLCRRCVKYNIEVIVVGSNSLWKQGSNMGKVTNQNFVSIPFYRFGNILKCVASKYGIAVVKREESYTSKASLPDFDAIPTYGDKDADKVKFSGKRTKKAYKLSDGKVVNADINGAGNIARKEYPELFNGLKRGDIVNAMNNIVTIKYPDLYKLDKKPENKAKPVGNFKKHVSQSRKQRHKYKRNKTQFYRELFAA